MQVNSSTRPLVNEWKPFTTLSVQPVTWSARCLLGSWCALSTNSKLTALIHQQRDKYICREVLSILCCEQIFKNFSMLVRQSVRILSWTLFKYFYQPWGNFLLLIVSTAVLDCSSHKVILLFPHLSIRFGQAKSLLSLSSFIIFFRPTFYINDKCTPYITVIQNT